MKSRLIPILSAVLFASSAFSAEPGRPAAVKELVLVHFSHTDFGFTDHPAVCREMQVRYLDLGR